MTAHQEVQLNLHFLLPGLLAEEIAEIREVQPQASLGVRRRRGVGQPTGALLARHHGDLFPMTLVLEHWL